MKYPDLHKKVMLANPSPLMGVEMGWKICLQCPDLCRIVMSANPALLLGVGVRD